MTVLLDEIWPLSGQIQYKAHFAKSNGLVEPLDVLARSPEQWKGWQEFYPGRNDFNRPYIFALTHFYHQPDTWLFGGIYRVLARHDDHYEVELTDDKVDFIGRLRLRSPYRGRTVRVNLENHYNEFEVLELMREPYAGRAFSSYEDIDLSFSELETIVRNQRPDWKLALEGIKGIYLITDIATRKRYVGSAYGEQGVWSRWCTYIGSGHGGNVELSFLLTDPSLNYCRDNFRFALLEHRHNRVSDDVILTRETFWKNILLTRGDLGLNRN